MKINNNFNISFKGYDARQIKGLAVIDKNCASALKKISEQTGLPVYTPNIASKSIRKDCANLGEKNHLLWTQDYLTILNHNIKAVIYDDSRDYMKRVLRGTADGMKKDFGFAVAPMNPHLRGGNFFICKNDGKNELLLSEGKDYYVSESMKKAFGVENVHLIPKLDYHLDLFIRPIGDGNVLVADNEITKKCLRSGLEKIQKYLSENNLEEQEKQQLESIVNSLEISLEKLEITEQFSPYKPKENTSKVINALKNAGYNPISVPACYSYLEIIKMQEKAEQEMMSFKQKSKELLDWSETQSEEIKKRAMDMIFIDALKMQNDDSLGKEIVNKYEYNFVNAIVAKNKKDELVYITNAPLFDKKLGITPEIEAKIGFSTKKMFLESVKPYIKPENVYFVNEKLTQKLFDNLGGIHCVASEIP